MANPSVPSVPFTLSTLPITLQDWRNSGWKPPGTYPRDIWTPLEDFFRSQGLTLWKKGRGFGSELVTLPPNNLPRCPDSFAYRIGLSDSELKDHPRRVYDLVKAAHCPARTTDNRDVLIRLITKGDDGLNHLTALRRIATGLVASRGENHAVPVFREITLEDMVFAVFPLMDQGFDRPWFYNCGELIDAVYQVLQGLSFCHDRLVAHLDIDVDNILVNFLGGPRQVVDNSVPRKTFPFREYFPVRYYLNDFELAACFEPDSDPLTRVVTGFPTKGMRGKYGREVAPEMLSDLPYCPFRTDIWQLGRMFLRCFGHLDDQLATLVNLFIEMSAEDPLSRPTASQSFERVRQFQSTLSPQMAMSNVARPPPPEPRESDEVDIKPANDVRGLDTSRNGDELDRVGSAENSCQ